MPNCPHKPNTPMNEIMNEMGLFRSPALCTFSLMPGRQVQEKGLGFSCPPILAVFINVPQVLWSTTLCAEIYFLTPGYLWGFLAGRGFISFRALSSQVTWNWKTKTQEGSMTSTSFRWFLILFSRESGWGGLRIYDSGLALYGSFRNRGP